MGVKHPELVLACAVACCIPMIPNLLAGNVSAATAGERFLIALIVCWVLGSLLSYVVRTYNAQAQRAQLLRLFDPQDGEVDQPHQINPE